MRREGRESRPLLDKAIPILEKMRVDLERRARLGVEVARALQRHQRGQPIEWPADSCGRTPECEFTPQPG